MAIVAISRQIAALGDEIAAIAAEKLGYVFIRRDELEKRIVQHGFPAEKLGKYDEKKPGFFAALVKDRDEYLHYLQTAVLEAASENNCVLIGRGSYIILEDVPNVVSFRLVAKDPVRLQRLENEFACTKKQAQQKIDESDKNRSGFHKSFFDIDIADPTHFHFVLNTGLIGADEGGALIADFVKSHISPELDALGAEKIKTLLAAQRLVNTLVFTHKINIEFLHAVIDGNTIILQGVADSSAVVEQAVALSKKEMPGYDVKSRISIVQDFKAHPK
ncbi:AAA family ATPase [Treponema sp. Marseille-Q4523]|uniref:cytidylate kinase-like family protein n=1 Tax=Treponema sp. Marseille-Q4523 TaxID=2810610 RepID=UPI001961DBA6|nr:cytidylate kinase-like family protein [Treponema sp. Marseille-Q4523]MBM7023822.1 cytidylate kinase-like family protein [Treponema sp. Marseille-Q4523]